MASFELDPDTIDYDNLPPLVPNGETALSVLRPLIRAWRETMIERQDRNWIDPGVPCVPCVTLDRVALVQEHEDGSQTPIDLGRLLRMLIKSLDLPDDAPVRRACVALRGCRIDACDARNLGLPFPFVTSACRFGGVADFRGARFGGFADFEGARFGEFAGFEAAHFGGVADFRGARFGGGAHFEVARFGGGAHFEGARFGGGAHFEGARFGGVARFRGVRFGGVADFRGARFDEVARFEGARFGGGAHFESAAVFYTDSRNSAVFGRPPPQRGSLLRDDDDEEEDDEVAPALWRRWLLAGARRAWWRLAVGPNSRRMHWGLPRGFGELAILTRVSTAALVIVPLLAGAWPAVRGAVDHLGRPYGLAAENMPWVWGFLFFAALFVVLGRAIYQAYAPQLVRERSRFDLKRDEMEEYRKTQEKEEKRWLQEAIDWLEEAGTDERLRWFRHPNLVTHNGRTVWIPSELEHFEDPREKVQASPGESDEEAAAGGDQSAGAAGERGDADSGGGEKEQEEMIETATQVMAKESRQDIAVQAGADAQYDIVARENRGWARVCLWCYTIAMILVVLVVWRQSMAILEEMGFDGVARLLDLFLLYGPWGGIALVLLYVVGDAWLIEPARTPAKSARAVRQRLDRRAPRRVG